MYSIEFELSAAAAAGVNVQSINLMIYNQILES